MSADAMLTAVERRYGITVLAVEGVIDLATAPELEHVLGAVVDDLDAGLVVDLTSVSFLASVGLRILAETHDLLGGKGRFAVVATGPVTTRPIQLTSLDEFLALYPNVDDAVASLGGAPT